MLVKERGGFWGVMLVIPMLFMTLANNVVSSGGVYVPPSAKLQLQAYLDQYGYVILEAKGDYRTGGLPELVLSTGQKIEGGYGTIAPKILIPGGVSTAAIVGVVGGAWNSSTVEFTGVMPENSGSLDSTNYDITIIGGSNGPGSNLNIKFREGAKVERLKASYISGVEALLNTAGYIRNSVFQAVASRSPGINITLAGNTNTPSYGNSILGFASTTPGGAANISQFGDLNLIVADAESWNCYVNANQPHQTQAFIISNMDALRMVGPSGGAWSQCLNTGAMTDISNTPKVVAWFDISNGGVAEEHDERLDSVNTYISTQGSLYTSLRFDNNPSDQVQASVLARYWPPTGTYINGANVVYGVLQSQKDALLSAYLGQEKQTHPTKPSKRFDLDPLGDGWNEDLENKPDSRIAIQNLINQNHIIKLSPGYYYLDAPLKIGSNVAEGIIGSDNKDVYLISKGSFPVIQGRGDYTTGTGVGIVLEGVSIYGGTYGLDFSNAVGNLGSGGQIRWSSIRNVRFSRQYIAGVNFENVYGNDNNIWYRVDFSKMPIAFRGLGSVYSGAGMTYADKQYFIDNQYQDISDTVWNWDSKRGSGSEVWIDSYFSNVGSVSKTRSAYNLLWVNSVFKDITGSVAIDILDSGSTATYFFTQVDCLWEGVGPGVVTDTQSGAVGTLFIDTEFNQANGSIVAGTGTQSLSTWNSKITGSATLGNVKYGALINSLMGNYNKTITYIHNGIATDVVDSPAAPYRQIMSR